ncbi:MAG: DUF4339 domain-containing protein [Candidatus Hydrogenedentota bacterium]
MSWYVYIEDESHGPYDKEELKNFLKPTDFVAKVGTAAWMEATKDPELAALFIAPPVPADVDPMWYVTPKGKPQRGRFTPGALANMLKKNTLQPDDLVRHESWDRGVLLRESSAYRKITSGGVKPEELTEADWLASEPAKQQPAPSVATPAASGAARSLRNRFRMDFEWTPVTMGMVALVFLLPLLGFLGYEYGYRGSDMEFRAQYGEAQDECAKDDISRTICAESPGRCGCSEKGSCAMRECIKFASYNRVRKSPGK